MSQPDETSPSRRFVFVTSNPFWGGSEALWSATAGELKLQGHDVSVLLSRHAPEAAPLERLAKLGCPVGVLDDFPLTPKKLADRIRVLMPAATGRYRNWALERRLRRVPADSLVVISQAGNIDGRRFARVCRRLGLRYVLISQKAQETIWPNDHMLEELHEAYGSATASFFVSEANRRLTEAQIGREIPRAVIVRNPFQADWDLREDWPDEAGGLRLACVGRLYPFDKGQDLVIQVLALPKWRKRALRLTFFGSGNFLEGLSGMAAHLGVTSVEFGGFAADPRAIWDRHHGLFLPSRGEGLPLVLVEAMMNGRVPVVTDVAGNAEVVDDNRTGFIAAAATIGAVDEALERAWQVRGRWREIGREAAMAIRTLVPPDPPAAFAAQLLRLSADD